VTGPDQLPSSPGAGICLSLMPLCGGARCSCPGPGDTVMMLARDRLTENRSAGRIRESRRARA
jgi:hypothetical protein